MYIGTRILCKKRRTKRDTKRLGVNVEIVQYLTSFDEQER